MHNTISFLFSLICLFPCAHASTENLDITPLTLGECTRIAKTKAPQAIQGLLAEKLAGAASAQASKQKLPHLYAVGTYNQTDNTPAQLQDANSVLLHVEQINYPFSPGWIKANESAAAYRASQYERIETEQDVVLLVKQLYFSILRDQDQIQRYSQVEFQLQKLLQTVIPKFNVGRAPSFDLVKVKMALADLYRNRNLVKAQWVGEKTELLQILGLDYHKDFQLSPLAENPQNAETLVKIDLDSNVSLNPSLQALTTHIESSTLGLKASRALRLPQLLTTFEYGFAGQTPQNMGTGWDVTVGLKLPLFDWGDISSQVTQSEINLETSQNKLELESQRVKTELALAQASAEAHLSTQKRLNALMSDIRNVVLASTDRYKRGAASILEVADAVNLWLQNLLNERIAYYSYLADLAKIERSTGKYEVKYE